MRPSRERWGSAAGEGAGLAPCPAAAWGTGLGPWPMSRPEDTFFKGLWRVGGSGLAGGRREKRLKERGPLPKTRLDRRIRKEAVQPLQTPVVGVWPG